MTSARPTAASAAATVITKNTMIWPSTLFRYRPAATNVMFTALSMISIDSRIVITLRRRNTPAVPIEKRIPDKTRYSLSVTTLSLLPRTTRDDEGADHRDEDQDRRHFEREGVSVRAVQLAADVGDAADVRDRRGVGAEQIGRASC